MHGLYALKDQIVEELEHYGMNGEFSRSELPTIDMLSHTAKNLCKLIEACEERTGYSYGNRVHMRGNYSYNDRGRYDHRSPYYDNSFARGRGRSASRDSMGRYSSDDDWMIETLNELKEKAPNDHMREEFDEFITRMERMK